MIVERSRGVYSAIFVVQYLWCCGVVVVSTAWTQVLCRFKSCLQGAGDSWRWGSVTMILAGSKAKCLPLVNHTTKTFHHHHSVYTLLNPPFSGLYCPLGLPLPPDCSSVHKPPRRCWSMTFEKVRIVRFLINTWILHLHYIFCNIFKYKIVTDNEINM